jgi:hypothetical protein
VTSEAWAPYVQAGGSRTEPGWEKDLLVCMIRGLWFLGSKTGLEFRNTVPAIWTSRGRFSRKLELSVSGT